MIKKGDRIKIKNFSEQSIPADTAIEIHEKGYSTVENILITENSLETFVGIKEHPGLTFWLFDKI